MHLPCTRLLGIRCASRQRTATADAGLARPLHLCPDRLQYIMQRSGSGRAPSSGSGGVDDALAAWLAAVAEPMRELRGLLHQHHIARGGERPMPLLYQDIGASTALTCIWSRSSRTGLRSGRFLHVLSG